MIALDRKMLRDLKGMRGAVIAIALVMGCGIAAFVVCVSALESVKGALADYYESTGFPQVFAGLKRAPNSLADRLAMVPGVSRVETRIVREVTLDVAGLDEPAAGRLISLPERGEQRLARLHLVRGRVCEEGRADEVVASESFAAAHGLVPGDRVAAVINGRRRELVIVGTAMSPEYVYTVREGEMLPDAKRFGVFWMPYRQLGSAFDMYGAFNSVLIALSPGASEAGVIRDVDRLTAQYGGLGAYGREDQYSHRFVSNELNQLRSQAVAVPVIFLGVTAFLLQMVVSRLLGTQRGQIATLKAFGYSNGQVGRHYLQMVVIITLSGAAMGIAGGAALGRQVLGIYKSFFAFPVFEYRLPGWIVATAVLIALVTALVATWRPIRRATKVPPAVAMRPEPPADYRPTLIERIGLAGLLPVALRMILRHLERRPMRSLLTALGLATATAVLVTGNFVVDTLGFVGDFQFYRASRQSMTVAFVEATDAGAAAELASMPGVRRVEPFRAVAARLSHDNRSRRLAIMGLGDGASLSRLLDIGGREVELPGQGVLLSAKLAEILAVRTGDVLRVDVLEGRRPSETVVVGAVIDDLQGLNAYMRMEEVWRLMREGPALSGAHLLVDPARERELYLRLKQTPRVAAVNILTAAKESFDKTISETLMTSRMVNLVFAVLIAIGVVYNSARISLAERGRDLATLRVLGFTRGEAAAILLGELGVLLVVSLVPGLFLGYALSSATMLLMDSEIFRMPLVISAKTYATAVVVTLLAAALTAMLMRRRIDRLSLVEVLKAAE